MAQCTQLHTNLWKRIKKLIGIFTESLKCIISIFQNPIISSCHVHKCPNKCTRYLGTAQANLKDFQRLADLQQVLDDVKVMRSCEWMAKKKTQVYKTRFPAKLSVFLGETKITQAQILQAVKDNNFFGILKVDIKSPPEVVEKYKRLNFPFIFRNLEISESMLSETILKLAKENNRKFPQTCITLTYNANDFIVTTPLLQFYLQLGMVVTNVYWAIQYVPTKPFEKFVKELVEVRIQSVITENPSLGDRAKFTLNSCVGRFGLSFK